MKHFLIDCHTIYRQKSSSRPFTSKRMWNVHLHRLSWCYQRRQHSYGQGQTRLMHFPALPFTGRLLMRQLVLPFLLGFKFNLASLLPLLFGMLIIITKKALLLTKVALFIAGMLGWNSLFGGYQGSSLFNNHGFSLLSY